MNYEKPQKLRVQKSNGKTVCNVLQIFVGPQVMSQSHVVYTNSVRVRVRVRVKCGCGCGAGEYGSAGAVRVKM